MDQVSEQNNDQPKNPIISWDFIEHGQVERSKGWYFSFILAIAVLLGLAVYQANFLFAVIVIIAAITFVHSASRETKQMTFVIDTTGVFLNDVFLPYDRISSFYVIINEETRKLFIEPRSLTRPRMAITLEEDVSPDEIKTILLKYIPENKERESEPLSEAMVRWFKL